MASSELFLKHNVQAEPLFNQWYAHPQLIAPATAAMHVTNSHLKIMKSYVSAPAVHANAIKNPAMRGGPFIDYQGQRSGEIRALMERTQKELAHLITFAEAIKQLNETLTREAKGYSMEALYQVVPEPLRGYVELVYGLNHSPTFRVVEGLLYKSEYYVPSLQSLVVSEIGGDERPFVFSTPRLEDPGRLPLRLPFEHPGIDELFRMRSEPRTFARIKDALELPDEHDRLCASLLTQEEPPRRPRYDGDRVRVRYFGHACVLVETKDVSILTDPVISYHYQTDFERYTYVDLPEVIDYVLITHSHADHLMFETLLPLRHRIKTIVVPKNSGGALEDPSLKLVLNQTGFDNVVEVDDMESLRVPGGSITALPFFGEHADLNIRSKAGYVVRLGDRQVMFVADSNNLEYRLYKHIHRAVGDVDILFVGMECEGAPLTWIYGPLFTRPVDRKMDHSRRLNGSDYERASDMVEQMGCRQAYVYAMGQEPWLCYLTSIQYTEESKPIVESNKLVAHCRERGVEAERLFGPKEIIL